MYIKMSENSSAKYYQDNKEKLQKNALEKVFVQMKKKTSDNMFVKDTKTSQKVKNKSWLSIEKIL